MKAPVYKVVPKNIFKNPFNKFDLDKPTTRQTQNQDLSDYFNYGFNEDTMNIYGKLIKRTIETLDESINPTYFDDPSKLMRLNDEIPMDFGGFCKFFDPSVFVNVDESEDGLQNMQNFHNGEQLFSYFIYQILMKKPEYPLIDFVKSLYRPEPQGENQEQQQNNQLDPGNYDIVDQIQKNLQRKYKVMMKALQEKKNSTLPPAQQKHGEFSRNRSDKHKKQDQIQQQSQSAQSASQESSGSSSSQSEKSRHQNTKRKQSKEKSKRRDKKIKKQSSKRNKKKRSRDNHSRDRSERKKRSRHEKQRRRSKEHYKKDEKRKDKRKDKSHERKKRRH